METTECKYTLNFGKYKGLTIERIFEEDKAYLIWLTKNLDANEFKTIISIIKRYLKAKQEELTYSSCLLEVLTCINSGKDSIDIAKEVIKIVKTY
jgi:hypothetical protein